MKGMYVYSAYFTFLLIRCLLCAVTHYPGKVPPHDLVYAACKLIPTVVSDKHIYRYMQVFCKYNVPCYVMYLMVY